METNETLTTSTNKTCGCGCGATVARRFLPGHDARLKGFLVRSVASRNWWEREVAVAALNDLGWLHFAKPEDLAAVKVRSRAANGRFTETRHVEVVRAADWTHLDQDDVTHSVPTCGSVVGSTKPERDATGWLCSACVHTEDWNEVAARSRKAAHLATSPVLNAVWEVPQAS